MKEFIIKKGISIFVIVALVVGTLSLPLISDTSVEAATKKVKVTYKANGGKFTAKKYQGKTKYTKKMAKNKKIGKLPKVTRTNYAFKGWYTKKTGGKKVTKKTKINKKTTLYAQWMKKYTINSVYDSLPDNGKEVLLTDVEAVLGKLTFSKKYDFGYQSTMHEYTGANDVTVGLVVEPGTASGKYKVIFVTTKMKNTVAGFKKTKSSTVYKKLGGKNSVDFTKEGSKSYSFTAVPSNKSLKKYIVKSTSKKYVYPDSMITIDVWS